MIGEILNDGDNIDDQEYFGFTGSCFNIVPTVIDDYTKNKFIYIELKQLRPMRTDERYQKFLIDDKESDERDKISTFDEEKMIEDIEVLKLPKLSSPEGTIYIEKESDEKI